MLNNSNLSNLTIAEVEALHISKLNDYNLAEDFTKKMSIGGEISAIEKHLLVCHKLKAFEDAGSLEGLCRLYSFTYPASQDKEFQTLINNKLSTVSMKVHVERTRKLDFVEYVEWATNHNLKPVVDSAWLKHYNDAKSTIVSALKDYIESEKSISVGALKKALQAALDALVFTEGKKGANAYVISSKMVRITVLSSVETGKEFICYVARSKNYNALFFNLLHQAITNKDISVKYGDDK